MEAGERIAQLRAGGYSWGDVARSLNAHRVPTPSGRGVWWPSTAQRHLHPATWAGYMRVYRRKARSDDADAR